MAYYRLYFLTDGRFSRCEEIYADSDAQAIDLADRKGSAQTMELWCKTRRVHIFEAGVQPA